MGRGVNAPVGEKAMFDAGFYPGAIVMIDASVRAIVKHVHDGQPVEVTRSDRAVELVDVARLVGVPLPVSCWTHSKCGAVVRQRGERTSHCPRCHVTFEGLTLFDAHQQIDAVTGSVVCQSPATMSFRGKRLKWVPGVRGADGSWRAHMDRSGFEVAG